MGRDSLRFNDERDIPYSGQYFGGHEVLQLLNRTDVHVGWTRPGDMLLNPVWLWHLVQTNEGNKFGITYKMGGHFIREFAQSISGLDIPGTNCSWEIFVIGCCLFGHAHRNLIGSSNVC